VAGVAALSIPTFRALWRAREGPAVVFLGFTLACAAYGLFGRLPGPNQLDKTSFVCFVPLALAGGFGVPLLWNAWRGRTALRTLLGAFLFMFLVPENALIFSAFVVDSRPPVVTAGEQALYAWIGSETPRDAVFLDSADRPDVLVRGPRRQYWGTQAYAMLWDYSGDEMARRRGLRDSVYAGSLDAEQLADLSRLDAPVFVIAREGDVPGIGERLLTRPGLFRPVYHDGPLRVFRVLDRGDPARR